MTQPDPPLPWMSYLGCEASFGIISNTAGGYSFYRDAGLRRLTRYRYNNAPFDFGGRSLDLRDEDRGDFAFPGAYRSWDKPVAVERGKASNSLAHGWAPHGPHHVQLNLKPGQTRELIFLLGYQEDAVKRKFDPPGSQTINKKTVQAVLS